MQQLQAAEHADELVVEEAIGYMHGAQAEAAAQGNKPKLTGSQKNQAIAAMKKEEDDRS